MTATEQALRPGCADCPVAKYWQKAYPEPLRFQRKRIAAFEQISDQLTSEADIRDLFGRAHWRVSEQQVADFAISLVSLPEYLEELRSNADNYDDMVEEFDVLGDNIKNVNCYGTNKRIVTDKSGEKFYKPFCSNRDAFIAAAHCKDKYGDYPGEVTNLRLQFIKLYSAHVMAKVYDGRRE